ncbi:MAG TPA: protein kinase [Pyrinomonadaceae bacterium]|nr:protein kinase [Pyrinomonadaceae bacterium]
MEDNSKTTETHVDPNSPARHELVGLILEGRFKIVKRLGSGGVGEVYLARDLKLHEKPVVVKVLLEKSLTNDWILQKFQQEKEALARVDHPGVVGILDTGALPNRMPYLVMQFIEGMSLRDAISAKPEGLNLERVSLIIKQASAALNAVHEEKIYHRDLKPENIMLQRLARGEEQVKIVDFGIAKVKESIVAPSTITGAGTAGTIMYMSPEQLHGDKITAASDVYSLGVIAYEMVTGRRPFNPDTIAQLSDMQRQGVRVKPADLRPRLPEEAQTIILKALSFDPRARYQNAADFGDALAPALMNEKETLPHYDRPLGELPSTLISTKPLPAEPQLGGQSIKLVTTPSEAVRAEAPDKSVATGVRVAASRWPKVVATIIVVIVLLVGGYLAIAKRESLFGSAKPSAGITASERSVKYSLTVQKMRDGKPYHEPFESSGQEIFENGYKFRLNVSSPQAGYLYVFNEGADEKTGMSFTIIYPTPLTNKGSAKLDANQTMQTNWNTFAGEAGTEEFWLVWSASPVTELEVARDAAFKSQEGALTDAAMLRAVKEFLAKHSDPKAETIKDTMKKQTDVRATGELLVKLVELEHR